MNYELIYYSFVLFIIVDLQSPPPPPPVPHDMCVFKCNCFKDSCPTGIRVKSFILA